MHDLERQRLAVDIARRLPAHRAIGMAAFGQDQRAWRRICLAALISAKLIVFWQSAVAGEQADVGGLEPSER